MWQLRPCAAKSLALVGFFCFQAVGHLAAQPADSHDHGLTSCVDLKPGEKRPEYGCWNIGVLRGLLFAQPLVYWHLQKFPARSMANAAKGPHGLVVVEEDQIWLSTFGERDGGRAGGEAVAVVGPLHLPLAKTYDVVLSYAVMRPGDRTPVHTHPGPEGWYVLAGEQCLDTAEGITRAAAGAAMTVAPNVPMELNVTGTNIRRSLVVVIHDSTQRRSIQSDWKPTGGCRR